MIRFEIPGRLPGTNEYQNANRLNRYSGAKMKKQSQQIVEWAIIAAKIKPVSKRVRINITWVEPNMRRDMDNITGARKFIHDALVSQGIIKDDGWKYIAGFSDDFLVDKKNPRIIVELEEQ